MSNATNLQDRLDLAIRAAREAGRITLEHFLRADLQVETKSDQSPVTVADREAELAMRQAISAAFPRDGIVGEEHGEETGDSGYTWVLDPIDGTKSFVAGVPLYATLVAVLHEDEPVIGLIHAAAAGEMVYAASGGGAWYVRGEDAPRPAKVSSVDRLEDALFVTTSTKSFQSDRDQPAGDVFRSIQNATRLTRTWGDAFGYLLVATGRAEIMIDPAMHIWDAAAMLPLLTEAGGAFVDWNGEPTVHSKEGIATNGHLTDAVLGHTRGR